MSVEDRQYGLPGSSICRQAPAAVRFLSIEPLLEDLGEINLDRHPLGDRRRRERARRPADAEGMGAVAFATSASEPRSRSSSSSGAVGRRSAGRELDGRTYDEFPRHTRGAFTPSLDERTRWASEFESRFKANTALPIYA